MKMAWYGAIAPQKVYFPAAEVIDADVDWVGECCAVLLDSKNEVTYDWLERQLRAEKQPKTWLLLSILPLTELVAKRSWLSYLSQSYLQLPASKAEIEQRLSQLKPLSAPELQLLRQSLFSESWRVLVHDAAKYLLSWPERKPQLQQALTEFVRALPVGYQAQQRATKSLLDTLDELSPQAIRELLERMPSEQAQASGGFHSGFGFAAQRQRLQSALRHWQALPDKINLAAQGLEKLGLNEVCPEFKQALRSPLDARGLEHLVEILQQLAVTPDYSGSALARLCHNTLEQHVFHVLDELKLLGQQPLAILTLSDLQRYVEHLGAEPELGACSYAGKYADGKHLQGALQVLIIENEPCWQTSILEALEVICHANGWTDQQVYFGPELCAASFQEAEALLKQYRQNPLLVITDLSIPEQQLADPSPEIGEKLLKYLLSAGQNLPLMLLTTPQHALTEQRRLTQLGFNQVDFVLKLRLDQLYERLEEWLHTQLERRFCHRLEFHEGLSTLKINGIVLELGKVSYALLLAFARAHQRRTRPLSAIELLESDLELQEALQAQQDPAGFSKSLYQLKKDLLSGLAQAGRFLRFKELLADSQNLQGQRCFWIPPQNQVLIRNILGAEQDDCESEVPVTQIELTDWLPLRLLIVEDEALWADEIQELALQMGFVCQIAGSITGAKAALGSFRPDILTLDLQLPEQPGGDGRDTGGFEVLQQARQLNPAIRVLIPSTHYRRSVLVNQAVRLDLPLVDFVPKGASFEGMSWLLHLYNRLRYHRLELQGVQDLAQTQVLLPLLNLKLHESAEGRLSIMVNGRPWSGATLEAKLLERLCRQVGQWLSYDELYQYIYSVTEVRYAERHEEFEQVLKRARKLITREWLQGKVSDRMGPALLERQGQRFCLHANPIKV